MIKEPTTLEFDSQEAGRRVTGLHPSCGRKSWEKCPMSTGWKGQSSWCPDLIHGQGSTLPGPGNLELVA